MKFFGKKQKSGSHRSTDQATETSRFRWILPGKFAVGPLPDVNLQKQLQQAGIQAVLTLCSETEGPLPEDFSATFTSQRFVLPDSHYEEALQSSQLNEAVQWLAATIAAQKPTYVHCLAGMERSPTVCVSYLCLYEKMPLWEALKWVKDCNPRTSITNQQLQVIQQLIQASS